MKIKVLCLCLLLGMGMITGCDYISTSSNNSHQNFPSENGNDDILTHADCGGTVIDFDDYGFTINVMETRITEDGGELAIIGNGNGGESAGEHMIVEYGEDVFIQTLLLDVASNTSIQGERGSKKDIKKDTSVALFGTRQGNIFVADEIYILHYAR